MSLYSSTKDILKFVHKGRPPLLPSTQDALLNLSSTKDVLPTSSTKDVHTLVIIHTGCPSNHPRRMCHPQRMYYNHKDVVIHTGCPSSHPRRMCHPQRMCYPHHPQGTLINSSTEDTSILVHEGRTIKPIKLDSSYLNDYPVHSYKSQW